jgi:hypothetical protein
LVPEKSPVVIFEYTRMVRGLHDIDHRYVFDVPYVCSPGEIGDADRDRDLRRGLLWAYL